ncbi:hypothetical protein T459_21928 [Capsicum annuum]|uniref:Uncharacterized protein n=1 Tax=Capsicum annuum TaxID=4072 RepID=A0A2G2YYC7_CAPAN|nr:hypothetical protein T459_21928 [Capsicum annuum]
MQNLLFGVLKSKGVAKIAAVGFPWEVGDLLKKAALKGIDWTYKSDEKATPKKASLDYQPSVPRINGSLSLASFDSIVITKSQLVRTSANSASCYLQSTELPGNSIDQGLDSQLINFYTFSKMPQVKEIVVICDPSYHDIFKGKMTSDSQMQDAATFVGATNIVTSSCTNALPTMALAEKPEKFVGIDFKR